MDAQTPWSLISQNFNTDYRRTGSLSRKIKTEFRRRFACLNCFLFVSIHENYVVPHSFKNNRDTLIIKLTKHRITFRNIHQEIFLIEIKLNRQLSILFAKECVNVLWLLCYYIQINRTYFKSNF